MNTLNSFSKNEETVESDDLNLEFFETARYCIFEYRNIFFFFFFWGKIQTSQIFSKRASVVRNNNFCPGKNYWMDLIISICGLNKFVLEEIKKGRRRQMPKTGVRSNSTVEQRKRCLDRLFRATCSWTGDNNGVAKIREQ